MRILTTLLFLVLCCQSVISQTLRDTLVVGYTSAPPFIIDDGNNLEGINIWLWQKVANDLGLEYKMQEFEFSTMLDALENNTIDVSINPLTITSERSKKMEFTHSFYASNATIVVAETSSYQKFIQFVKGFFSTNFLKGLLVLLLIIFLFGLVGWYFERKENPEQFRSGHSGIWDGMWWSAVTLTTVGYGDKAPKTRMGKIAALVLMFGGLLFISGLTASIASSLTVNQLNSDLESFSEFKESSVGSVKNTSTTEFLKSHFFKKIKLFDRVELGLEDLKENNIDAFIYDEPILKYRIQQDSSLSTLNVLPIKFDVQFYAFGVTREKRELERAISLKILEIIETNEWQVLLSEFGLSEF